VKIKFPQGVVEVDLTFADLVKVDDSPAEPHGDDLSRPTLEVVDPVGGFFQKGVELEQQATGTVDFDICKAILSEADCRDREPSSITLHKNSLPDWSWSAPISDTLGKRATHGTARERFRRELEKFFAGHSEEYEEAAAIAAEAVSEELSTIESEAA